MTRSMRLELEPNFSRRNLAIWALSFSIVSCVTIRPFLAAASSLVWAAAPQQSWIGRSREPSLTN